MISISLVWVIIVNFYYPCSFCLLQVVIMLVSLVVIFFMTWTPWSIYILHSAAHPVAEPKLHKRMVTVAIQSVPLVNSMINPIIYAITSP